MSLTPEERFHRWTRWSLAIAALAFIYFVIADMHMPLTPHSRLLHKVTPVAAEVSGRVVSVNVRNSQFVNKGDVLFTIDDRDYRTAVHDAQMALQQTLDSNSSLDASIAEARASLAQAQAGWAVAKADSARYQQLRNSAVSRQQADQALGNEREYAAQVAQMQAKIHNLEIQRGLRGNNNLHIRQAENNLHQANTNLSRTEVRALEPGYISNLNLVSGDYASTSTPLLSIVSTRNEIYADFREKSLRYITSGSPAAVVFDAFPGKVFHAHLTSQEAGIADGQIIADGKLATTEESDRWVRDAQRLRVYFQLDDSLPKGLPSGARATVQLTPTNPVFGLLSWLQIHLIAMLHYVY
ncbi:HlyD family secretion protein [Shimwellia blattae]|uniref:Secretion protein HlyD family protein n=1 Tax=Shimwellia blattae (strain ATCC 29907 / DSM 4481 / JCM 1650 / NBRC 105725 / CDC 9005-74) TaxID=630626 RepID=I2B949_SHIBC|nr:HlyD family secretion protein [Shimwellia blattae]AFJ47053.1 secretion protein HlyD family protein [Shimwellia blattae DSM 4481 = NBRC 105725]GAB80825.1 hypothetical protein EB105725_10_00120 [Shimwellia blattae DSM 4481 = NBRC 105725]VDY64546.1 Inner membrane protein yibH [Shimwellia blattae]VEC22654.1 Inner membrane protein yibH [Shimwellia blattae]